MPITVTYFIQYDEKNWGAVDFCVRDDNTLENIRLNGGIIQLNNPHGVCPAYDNKTQTLFWLQYSKGSLYRIDYSLGINKALFAMPIIGSGTARYIAIESFKLPFQLLSKYNYSAALLAGKQAYDKMLLKQALKELEIDGITSDLLTEDDLLSLVLTNETVCFDKIADESDNVVFRKTQAFGRQCSQAYIFFVTEQLSKLLRAHLNDYVGLKQALKAYLRSHWQAIKSNSLSYTALPNHPVTRLLVNIAQKLENIEGDPAISYLMPDVYTQPTVPLEQVLKRSILDESGHYLLSPLLIVDYVMQFNSTQKLNNPDYNPYDDKEQSHCYVTLNDIERLFNHSNDTQLLRQAYQALQLLERSDDSLLSRLKDLIRLLTMNSTKGIGHETNAGTGVYTAVPEFMEYYRRLYPVGLHVCKNEVPLLSNAFGAGSRLGYVFVKQGVNAGLYFLSRYDIHGFLLQANAPDRVQQLCDSNTVSKYPIEMIKTHALTDTVSFMKTLSKKHPTLIRVVTDDSGKYYFYHKNHQGDWCFSTLYHAPFMPLPSRFNQAVLQPPQTIPNEMYTLIKQRAFHHHEERVLDIVTTHFLESTRQCTPQQLSLIFTQTGHLDLNEFKPVPQSIRQLLSDIWLYIQHPAANVSATESTQTCIAGLKNNLEPLVTSHSNTLYDIRISESDKQHHYQQNKSAVENATRVLQQSFDNNTYSGVDLRAPSVKMLKLLDIELSINDSDDFTWFCSFPPEVMIDFLNEEDNPNGPLRYIRQTYRTFSAVAELFLSLPIHAYLPILRAISFREYEYNWFIELLNFLDNDHKKEALFHAFCTIATRAILTSDDLRYVLMNLNDAQRDALLVVFQDTFSSMITRGYQLEHVLECLNPQQRKKVLLCMRGSLPSIDDKRNLVRDYHDEMHLALSHSHHGFFNAFRTVTINTGSLDHKLTKYIDSRQKEGGFHWDFLGVMAFFYWLSGTTWVKAKNTKLAAATYALKAHQGHDDCLVRLIKLDTIPADYSLHKNSYLLIDSKKLYYVDYAGHPIQVSMKDKTRLQSVFDTNTNCQLTYDQVHDTLSSLVKDRLPTDVQLEALTEGLLGDILIDADVDYILKGTTRSELDAHFSLW